MKAAELRKLAVEELKAKLVQTRKDLLALRFRNATGQLTNKAEISATRHEIARILTILEQKGA